MDEQDRPTGFMIQENKNRELEKRLSEVMAQRKSILELSRTIPTAEELESKIGRLARRLSTDEGKMQVAMDPRTIPSGNWVMVRLARTSDAGNLIDTTAAKRQPILAGVVVKCGPGVDESKFYTGLGVNIFPAAATTITERVALVETMAIAFTFDVDAAIEGVE